MTLNKKIWIYWSQGWDKIPPIVEHCIASWKKYNPGWQLNLVDDTNLIRYFDFKSWDLETESKNRVIPLPAKSDIIRMNLLYKYGGVWADATTWCHKPLDEWVTTHMVSDFFAFSNPTKKRLIAPWFLCSTKNSYMIKKYTRKIQEYWKNRERFHDYYWVHGLFNELYSNDTKFKTLWDNVSKIDCPINSKENQPHYFVDIWCRKNETHGVTPNFKNDINSHSCPVYKLTRHVKNITSIDEFKYLFNTL